MPQKSPNNPTFEAKPTYDGVGRRLTEVDQANRTMRFTYDDVGNLASVMLEAAKIS